MPDLVRLYKAHKADGVVVLAINMTFQDSVSDVQAFVKEFNMTFPVLLDETGAVAHGQYRVRGLPMTFFVDRKGINRPPSHRGHARRADRSVHGRAPALNRLRCAGSTKRFPIA